MWLIFGPIIALLFIYGAVWLRNRWIVDDFNSYGVYGNMAGLYLYRRFGLWHIGTSQEESSREIEAVKQTESTISGKLKLKQAIPNS